MTALDLDNMSFLQTLRDLNDIKSWYMDICFYSLYIYILMQEK